MIKSEVCGGRALRIAIEITVLVLLLATSIFSAQAAMYPEAKVIVLSEDSSVKVTFEGASSSYNNLFGFWSPNYQELFWGHSTSPGANFDLGYFPSYTELIFFIKSPDGTFLSGPGNRNPDGTIHAAITDIDFQTWRVGFEDLKGGGDRDYNDITVLVKGDFYVIPPNPIKPDFIILSGDITFSNNNPSTGDIVEVEAKIRNFGKSINSDVAIAFYDGNPDAGGQLITTEMINGIGKEELIIKSILWDTAGKPGPHNIYVKIDPGNLIDETLENNNIAIKDIIVGKAPTPISIKILSPSAFSNYQIGSSQTIEWTYTGDPGSYVKIELLKCLFSCELLETIEPQTPIGEYGSGSYLWKIIPPIGVDYLPGDFYRIRIMDTDNSVFDTSMDFIFNNQPISLPGIITEIRTDPVEPLIRQDYRIYLHLYNPNSIAEDYYLWLKNSENTKCELLGDNTKATSIPAGAIAIYSFSCQSKWDWIPDDQSGWAELGESLQEEGTLVILEDIEEAIESTQLHIVPIADNALSILSTLKLSYEIEPSKLYHVDLSSESSSGITFDSGVNQNIIVNVPSSKKVWLVSSAVYDMGSTGLSMIGVLTGLITGGTTAVVSIVAEALNVVTSWAYYQQAYDPDFNYTTVQDPIPMYLPELNAIPDGDAKKFALATADITSLRNATLVAYVRYDGARIDNQSDYMLMQLEAANNFTLQSIKKMPEVVKYYRLLTDSMEPLTDEQIQQVREEIQTNGLPQIEIDILTRNGLGDSIENITQMVLNMSPEVYRNPKNYTKFLNFQTAIFAYDSTEYMSEIIRIRVENKGYSNTTASDSDIAYLEDLKGQIQLGIVQRKATPEMKVRINEMIGKSTEVLEETNNLTYMPYYEFAVNALAIFQTLDTPQPTQLSIVAPADITETATGTLTTIANLGTPTVTGGATPYNTVNNAPAGGFPVGKTTVTWTVTDSNDGTASDTQLVTINEDQITPPPPVPELSPMILITTGIFGLLFLIGRNRR